MVSCPFTDPRRLHADLAVRAGDGLPYSEIFRARVVTRYDDIVRALHDPATFSSAPAVPDLPPPWRLHYLGRSRDRMAYADELIARHGDRVEFWASRDRGRFDLDRLWPNRTGSDSFVYACGPENLLTAIEDAVRRAGREEPPRRRAVRAANDRARTGSSLRGGPRTRRIESDRGRARDPARRPRPRRGRGPVHLPRGAPAAPARSGSSTASPSTATRCSPPGNGWPASPAAAAAA